MTGTTDNHLPLKEIGWQVHVYGAATPELSSWCATHGLKLHVFTWQREHQAAGLARDALYLLRPDTYVALADTAAKASSLDDYFAKHQITPSVLYDKPIDPA
jgi:hypothetical protein